MRVGENPFEMANGGTNRRPPQQEIPKAFGNRLVTEGSRLVTAPILLVNTRVRKHWISVSGLTRRTFRRAATLARDDRLHGNKPRLFRDEANDNLPSIVHFLEGRFPPLPLYGSEVASGVRPRLPSPSPRERCR